MPITTARLAVAAALSALLAGSLRVAPDSPCSKFCGNSLSSTAVDEMACDAGTLEGTTVGLVWEKCTQCLLTSDHVSGNQTDLQWLLYNLRFNMGHCLFDGRTNPCITKTACEPLKDGVQYQNLTTVVGPYDFCRNWEMDSVPHCSGCLEPFTDGLDGMAQNNYMMMLEAACEQTPAPGATLSILGDPFGNSPVQVIPPQPSYSTIPGTNYGPVSLGARVGIALGALAAILAVLGFCIVCNGKRRRRAYLRQLEQRHGGGNPQNWPHAKSPYSGGGGGSGSGSGQDMFETPVSQRPLRGWESESPLSAHTDGSFPRYFSPYTSQHNSPISGPDSATGGGPSSAVWQTLPMQAQLDQLIRAQHAQFQQQQFHQQNQFQQQPFPQFQHFSQSPLSPPAPAAHMPGGEAGAPAFAQWPTVAQETHLMQMHAHHERRQREMAVGIALAAGDGSSIGDKAAAMGLHVNGNGYPIETKGKEREGEQYEMRAVESPYGDNGSGNGNGDGNGMGEGGGYEGCAYRVPAEPPAPVLHHPGYGRHHGPRDGSGGTGRAAAGAGVP
ncbi:hypothetical protein BT67DRAFT_439199 [Trichocladium antarcticum]|uniref:Uncharacterized protein n=1 Tax=Trichocladium antarcticum TaxID=1450529 RepID=A0AAN6URQ2_9PEZI|nr:hypothetical protein BT67DRAFT_439199 [Trichocladium antarcticum]